MTIGGRGGGSPRMGGSKHYKEKNEPGEGNVGTLCSQTKSREGASWLVYLLLSSPR